MPRKQIWSLGSPSLQSLWRTPSCLWKLLVVIISQVVDITINSLFYLTNNSAIDLTRLERIWKHVGLEKMLNRVTGKKTKPHLTGGRQMRCALSAKTHL